MNDEMTSHSIFGAFANIGFAGITTHSCTGQAFAGLLNALPLNQMTLLCTFILHCKDTKTFKVCAYLNLLLCMAWQ